MFRVLSHETRRKLWRCEVFDGSGYLTARKRVDPVVDTNVAVVDRREPVLAIEPGLNLPDVALKVNSYPEKGMYFGGVGVAMHDPEHGFDVAADPRREGGTYTSNAR